MHEWTFAGHKKKINAMQATLEGDRLLSACSAELRYWYTPADVSIGL
jgi:hypothetical protein